MTASATRTETKRPAGGPHPDAKRNQLMIRLLLVSAFVVILNETRGGYIPAWDRDQEAGEW